MFVTSDSLLEQWATTVREIKTTANPAATRVLAGTPTPRDISRSVFGILPRSQAHRRTTQMNEVFWVFPLTLSVPSLAFCIDVSLHLSFWISNNLTRFLLVEIRHRLHVKILYCPFWC